MLHLNVLFNYLWMSNKFTAIDTTPKTQNGNNILLKAEFKQFLKNEGSLTEHAQIYGNLAVLLT